MQPQDIHLSDWHRIFIGEVPLSFFIELLIRAIVAFLILMISMRGMGKRMSLQLSRNELAALVSLAAAVGIPLMAPDRGILPALVIAFILIVIQRLIAVRSFKSEKFETFSQGKIGTLVSDGVVDMKQLTRVSLSHERVFAQLRSVGVLQLGSVSRFYMEANGTFTLISLPEAVPGLSVLPPWDDEMSACFQPHDELQVCVRCGFLQKQSGQHYPECPNCASKKWVAAVTYIKNE